MSHIREDDSQTRTIYGLERKRKLWKAKEYCNINTRKGTTKKYGIKKRESRGKTVIKSDQSF